ncbi:ABC transporter ATP-binding protein [Clostridiaceae bacterium M8S5]|nr:ABC transporter ATP-binding protein [Clostridiaceae bacterium M8S5]
MKKKDKPLYSTLSNIIFLFKIAWKIDKTLLLVTVLQIPMLIALPLLPTYLTKYIVELVTIGTTSSTLIKYILYISCIILFVRILNNYLSTSMRWRAVFNRFNYITLCSDKVLDMDYYNIESPSAQIKLKKATNAFLNNNSSTEKFFKQLVDILANLIGLATYTYLILHISPFIIFILFVMTTINYYINTKNNQWIHQNKENWVLVDRKLEYIINKLGDFEVAKDMRLYDISSWFKKMFSIFLLDRLSWTNKKETFKFFINFICAIMMFLKDGVAYVFLIYQVTKNNMSASEFVFYFALISKYSDWLLGLINSYNTLQLTSLSICDLREFLDIPDSFNKGKGPTVPKKAPNIIFNNVSFKYPNCENDTLKNLDFNIKSGEKIAIVGLNGAGKTTLVKLLSGLYRQTKGTIKIDEHELMKYNRDDYYKLLSVVFQDIMVMPVSIEENIALSTEKHIDKLQLKSVIKSSGLESLVQKLPSKEKTILLKSVHDDAVDLSGGEMQKLALARALYKNGKIVILDEPTSALDPIAENEMYLKYNSLTKDTTSIFISHRLSSTRFCDRIFFLENGEIIEEGTHDDLIKLGGKYANMFELQSHYYKEGCCNETVKIGC